MSATEIKPDAAPASAVATFEEIKKGRATLVRTDLNDNTMKSIRRLLEDLEADEASFAWVSPNLMVGYVNLTPPIAQRIDSRISSYNSVIHNYETYMRPITESRVHALANQMQGGYWRRPADLEFGVCDAFGDERYVAENGNHRRRAVLRAANQNASFTGIPAVVHIWVHETEQSLANHVSHYDTGVRRSAEDINSITGDLARLGYVWSKSDQRNMNTMITELMFGASARRNITTAVPAEHSSLARTDWAPTYALMQTIRDNNVDRKSIDPTTVGLRKSDNLSFVNFLMAVTLRSRPLEANAFWAAVYANSSEAVENKPVKEAITVISMWNDYVNNHMKALKSESPRIKSLALFRRLIQCWNSYVLGENSLPHKMMSTDDIRYTTLSILGTPYMHTEPVFYTPHSDRKPLMGIHKTGLLIGPYDSDYEGYEIGSKSDSIPRRYEPQQINQLEFLFE